jgi:hypothetical protein
MASGYGLTGGMLLSIRAILLFFKLPAVQRCAPLRYLPTDHALGVSRCFPFWQEYLACYIVNQNEDPRKKNVCVPVLEDYYECLHHKKEVTKGHIPVNRCTH